MSHFRRQWKVAVFVCALVFTSLPAYIVIAQPQRSPLLGPSINAVRPANSAATLFDDFSSYAVGTFPAGWSLLGSTQMVPTIAESGGVGGSYQVFNFPGVGGQYWDAIAARDGLHLSGSYTVQVKLRFLDGVADRGGLTIALKRDTLERIDIQPNVYWDDIEFRSSYGGDVNTLMPSLAIQSNVDYWLRVVVQETGSISVYWSTDGSTFD